MVQATTATCTHGCSLPTFGTHALALLWAWAQIGTLRLRRQLAENAKKVRQAEVVRKSSEAQSKRLVALSREHEKTQHEVTELRLLVQQSTAKQGEAIERKEQATKTAEQATAAAAVANRSQAVFESIAGSPTFAERNPFSFFGDDTAAKRSQADVQSKQNEHVPTMAPPPQVLEHPPVPTTITGRTRTRSKSNDRSRRPMVAAVHDDYDDDGEAESVVERTTFFSELLGSFRDDDLDDEDTDYTDISAISSRSIRSRIWEQMKQDDAAARQAAGMGLPMMRPIHE